MKNGSLSHNDSRHTHSLAITLTIKFFIVIIKSDDGKDSQPRAMRLAATARTAPSAFGANTELTRQELSRT